MDASGKGKAGGEPGEELTEELAKRYDPERLLKMVANKSGVAGEVLDVGTRAKFEQRYGVDLGHVRVIRGRFADAMTAKHNAYALTVGRTGMVLMSSAAERSSVTAAGRGVLAHELKHVAQAKAGMFAQSRDDSNPFGDTHEAERQAHAEERREMGDAGHAADADSAAVAEAQKRAVIARAMELVGEWMEQQRTRAGR